MISTSSDSTCGQTGRTPGSQKQGAGTQGNRDGRETIACPVWGRTSGLEDGAAGGARTLRRDRPSPKARSAHPKLPFLTCDTGMLTPPALRHFRGLGQLHTAEAPGQCQARSESYSFIFQVKNETGKRRIILKYRRSRNRLIDTEDKVIVARWKGLGGLDDKGSGIKKHKWTVTATGTESTAEETRSVL